MTEKTEAPTPRRLRRARSDGDVPLSAALTQAVAFMAALALIPSALAATVWQAAARLRQTIHGPGLDSAPAWVIGDLLTLTVPLLVGAAVASSAAALVQTGGVVSLKKLAPDFARANPLTGLKNIFNLQRLLAVARALIAALLVGWLAIRGLIEHGGDLAHCIGNPAAGGFLGAAIAREIAWLAALAGLTLAALDLLVTRHLWWQRLKMSRDEVKREHREAEGDHEQKAARQRAHQEVLSGAMLTAVRQATVVVVNPTHLASALRYDEGTDDAPLVLAQGRGELARRIVEEARAHGVPVVRDVPVARALAELEVGEQIPEALFEAVAEILRELWETHSHDAPPQSPNETRSPIAVNREPGRAEWNRTRA